MIDEGLDNYAAVFAPGGQAPVVDLMQNAERAVGDRERVMAGTDCGFGTIVGDTQVSEDVVWAKLEAMRDSTAIANKRLWN